MFRPGNRETLGGKKMKNLASAIAVVALLALTVQAVSASEVLNVVGYNRIPVPANSDVRLSLPFTPQAEGDTYTVSAKSGTTLTVTPALTTTYGSTYYVRFVEGNASGLWGTLSSGSASTVVLADATVATHVNVGDKFRIYKHYTLATVFPKGMLNVSFTTTSQILIYENNLAAMGQNKSAAKTAFYVNGNWVGAGVTNNTILTPETQFILRNNSSQELTFVTQGVVPDYAVSLLVAANGDLNIGTGYPVPVTLKNAGLGGTGRQVLFYDNTATGLNKSAAKTAFYVSGNWVGAGVTGNELLTPSETITLRLPSSEAGTKITVIKPY